MASHRAVPSLVVAVLVTVALASVAVTAVGLRRDSAPDIAHVSDPASVAEPRPEVEAAAVLAAWDTDRAAAWAAGDVGRLRSLYAPGSVAGERDVAMLRRWLDRGLVVTGIQMQVLSLRELFRSPHRMALAVVDRVVGAAADGVALPSDTPTARTLELRRVDGEWLVASVANTGG